MTGKLKPSERDWLWLPNHFHWKSKKSDWLDLDIEVVRETTRHGEKHFHVRNLSSFRELRREMRFERAQKKLEELWEDKNSVLGHVTKPADTLLAFKGPVVTRNEFSAAMRTGSRLQNDINRLLYKLSDSDSIGDINALWRVIETVGHVGRFMGEVSYRRTIRTDKGRKIIAARVERRREILTPLIWAEIKINPKAVAKRAFEPANELLIANGEEPIGFSTFAELISKTKPPK